MFRFLVVLSTILAAFAFHSQPRMQTNRITMSLDKNVAKIFGTALIIGSVIGAPTFPVEAKEGAAAKIGIFTNSDASSPFAAGETREDPLYSPYSPYGNGDAAVYKNRKGSPEEVKFWKAKFDDCSKRVTKIPAFAAAKTWSEITTELTRGLYNYRESMLRLAASSTNPKAAEAAAKTYFSDLEDVYVFSEKKNGDVVLKSYEKSVKDLETFKALVFAK